jgi:hypothetical protein
MADIIKQNGPGEKIGLIEKITLRRVKVDVRRFWPGLPRMVREGKIPVSESLKKRRNSMVSSAVLFDLS